MTRRLVKHAKPVNAWLGGRLCSIRKRLGLTQRRVARLIDRTDSTFSDMENGYSDITVDRLSQFAAGLDLPVAALLLPDAGRPASAPFSESGGGSSDVVDLLSDPSRRALVARVLEALPGLSQAQLEALVRGLSRTA